jgi:carbon monoxide dehydrogenase subunit G
MSLRIEETFELHAPVDRTWRYLVDPRQVAHCLPGARTVTITGRDDVAHVVSMVGEGREVSGASAAKMTMTSRLTPLSGVATQVQVVADLDIIGSDAIGSVNRQLVEQFTERLRGALEAPVADLSDFPIEAPPSGWVPPASRRTATAIPLVPPPASPPARFLPLVMHAFGGWLRRLGIALVGRPRHP